MMSILFDMRTHAWNERVTFALIGEILETAVALYTRVYALTNGRRRRPHCNVSSVSRPRQAARPHAYASTLR